MTRKQREAFSFQFITHRTKKYGEYDSAVMALEGGCRWIQLRMKNARRGDVKVVGLLIQSLCEEHGAVFVLDDDVDLCKEIGADGVHLGKQDMSPQEARKILGNKCIIGSTCNTYEDILAQATSPVDYIGLGPFRFTSTKANLSPVLGIEQYVTIMKKCRQAGISLPIVAIGGIKAGDIFPLLMTGVDGVAVSGAILQASNPVEEALTLLNEIKTYKR